MRSGDSEIEDGCDEVGYVGREGEGGSEVG